MPTPLFVRAAVWLWLLFAVFLGHARLLTSEPAYVHVLSVLLPALVVIVGGLFIGQVREWIDELDLRMLVFLHTTRLLAIFYLILHGRGQLPGEFALTVAWGEIAIAVAALVLGVLPLRRAVRLRAIGIWNIAGLVTAGIGLVTAARVALGGDLRLLVFTELPFNLVPTFLAPLVLGSHVLLYRRLQREARAPSDGTVDETDAG